MTEGGSIDGPALKLWTVIGIVVCIRNKAEGKNTIFTARGEFLLARYFSWQVSAGGVVKSMVEGVSVAYCRKRKDAAALQLVIILMP
jgi:hypothetical protein